MSAADTLQTAERAIADGRLSAGARALGSVSEDLQRRCDSGNWTRREDTLAERYAELWNRYHVARHSERVSRAARRVRSLRRALESLPQTMRRRRARIRRRRELADELRRAEAAEATAQKALEEAKARAVRRAVRR